MRKAVTTTTSWLTAVILATGVWIMAEGPAVAAYDGAVQDQTLKIR